MVVMASLTAYCLLICCCIFKCNSYCLSIWHIRIHQITCTIVSLPKLYFGVEKYLFLVINFIVFIVIFWKIWLQVCANAYISFNKDILTTCALWIIVSSTYWQICLNAWPCAFSSAAWYSFLSSNYFSFSELNLGILREGLWVYVFLQAWWYHNSLPDQYFQLCLLIWVILSLHCLFDWHTSAVLVRHLTNGSLCFLLPYIHLSFFVTE